MPDGIDTEPGSADGPDAAGGSTDDAVGPAAGTTNPGDAATPPDRRTFLRQLSTDAVRTAGKMAGASAAFSRSIVAAGGSALGAFDQSDEPADSAAPRHTPATTHATAQPPLASSKPAPAPPTSVIREVHDAVAALTPEQHAFLRNAPKAALAVNDPAGPPLLAYSIFHWDGDLIRVPARDFTARTNNIDLDRRVGLLVDDPASEAWVAMNGLASLVYGDQVEPEMRLILAKYHDEDEANRRWNELSATGDQIVIRIRPTRFVWRSG